MAEQSQRWVVTGATGMLGTDVVTALRARGHRVDALSSDELDIRDSDACLAAVDGAAWVVNCAAFTDVDGAESNPDAAYAVNADGVLHLARACEARQARMIHVSTDYVFSGDARTPYAEHALTNPSSAYGKSKAAGERNAMESGAQVWIVRTAWLYGANGRCFPSTIAEAARRMDALTVVNDQVGQPTWTKDVAQFMIRLIGATAPPGIYHATSGGQATWYEFAREVVASTGLDTPVLPVTSAEFPRPAPRPGWSVLGHDASLGLGVEPIGHWRERWRVAASEVLGL